MNQLSKNEINYVLSLYGANDSLKLKALHHLTSTEILLACRAYDSVPFGMATHRNITIKDLDNTTQKRISIDGCYYSYRFDYSNGGIAVYKDGKPIWAPESQQFLTQHYFKEKIAIPLYFPPDHWARGKTAIDLGLAIPKTDLLIELLNREYNGNKNMIEEWFYEQQTYHDINFNSLKTLDEKISELQSMVMR